MRIKERYELELELRDIRTSPCYTQWPGGNTSLTLCHDSHSPLPG
jgi:hypothetical protein